MAIKKRPNLDIILGLFIAIALIVLVLLIFLIGQERRLFDTRVELKAHFPNVAGLSVGADVMLSGVIVGHVNEIKFPSKSEIDDAMKDITVVMHISHKAMEWIKEDSIANLDTKGLLGDKLINISIGSPNLPRIKSGSMIESAPPLDLNKSINQAQKVLENANQTITEAKEILQNFKKEGGDKALASSAKSVAKILQEIESGEGILHEIIYDQGLGKEIKQSLSNVKNTTHSIESLTKDIKEGRGSLGLLIQDPSLYNELYGLIGNLRRNALLKSIIRHNLSKEEKEVKR